MQRRRVLMTGLTALTSISTFVPVHAQLPSPVQARADLPDILRAGACVVMLRHAQTDPGLGDPADFRIGQCSTQRNLSEAGRAQARRIGQWFEAQGLQARAVQSSAWCRCRETAELAGFGVATHSVLPALGSTFSDGSSQEQQTAALRTLLSRLPAGRFDVWVTHQVNISALTGVSPAMGEAVVLGLDGKPLARASFV